MSTIKVISFDLDDTLWAVKPALIRAEKLSTAFLAEQCPELYLRFSFEDINERRIGLYKARPDLRHQISKLRTESVRLMILECGYSDTEAQRLAEEAFAIFIKGRHDVTLYPGVEQCLQQLHGSHTLVALTNGNADVRRLDIARFFDFSLKAEDINSSKPAAPHFELTLQRYGIEAEHMLHVGDHAEHDVFGAQQLGIKTAWVNAKGADWPSDLGHGPADLEVDSVTKLPPLISQLA